MNNFLHFGNCPSMRMASRRSKLQVVQPVVVPNAVLVMNCETTLTKPQHGVRPHRVMLVHDQPVFENCAVLSQRMTTHAVNHHISARCFPSVANSIKSFLNPRFALNAALAKTTEPLSCVRSPKSSHNAASRAFYVDASMKFNSPAWPTRCFGASNFSIEVFVGAKRSRVSTGWTRNLPASISEVFGHSVSTKERQPLQMENRQAISRTQSNWRKFLSRLFPSPSCLFSQAVATV